MEWKGAREIKKFGYKKQNSLSFYLSYPALCLKVIPIIHFNAGGTG